ncbi:MAG TPA: tripartite tricarboxylate transporter TctB family protein [Burkholderiales bacterium]|nr:tripartite tricarboxylate transporter TctB family protein [Burkholderiales bacterium]
MEETSEKSSDLWAGLALAALGVYIVVQAAQWEYLGPDGPGPGFFPLWYGIAMVVLSAALVVAGVRARVARAAAAPFPWARIGRALLVWLAFAVSVALSDVLGFTLSFGLLCFFIVAVMYRRPLKVAAAAAVASALGFYAVFPLALGVSLPTGWVGF